MSDEKCVDTIVCESLGYDIDDKTKVLYKVSGSVKYEGENYVLFFSKKEDAEKALEKYNLLKKTRIDLRNVLFWIEKIYYF